jgi:dUTPase
VNELNILPKMYSAEKKVIPAHGKALVDTQLSIAVPAGTYGRVAPRSGLGRSCFVSRNVWLRTFPFSIKIYD